MSRRRNRHLSRPLNFLNHNSCTMQLPDLARWRNYTAIITTHDNRRQEEEPMNWEDVPFLPEVSAPFVPSRSPWKMRSLISIQMSEHPSLSANHFPNMRAIVPKVTLWMEGVFRYTPGAALKNC
ncbi:hypothetical protein TNIN_405311 [Trichonephila inaurata madagascariensis]|uniref:Uncharacterized protein n=1 Tax=Trichonephila inaurata madagascariensis TaxID=2747483 RepID=A0A8X7C4D0_9ARAC|nr:hypothetical protein TNIN_405311 [Trichonephila inaurata madagascariensis]